jgi:hypothetical protein
VHNESNRTAIELYISITSSARIANPSLGMAATVGDEYRSGNAD